MASLFELSSDELILIANLIAIALSKSLTLQELNVLGNFIVAIGGIMLTIAAQDQALVEKDKSPQEDLQKQITELREQIEKLRQP